MISEELKERMLDRWAAEVASDGTREGFVDWVRGQQQVYTVRVLRIEHRETFVEVTAYDESHADELANDRAPSLAYPVDVRTTIDYETEINMEPREMTKKEKADSIFNPLEWK